MNKNRKRKVAIVGTVGIPARYGGFETLVENLTDMLGEEFRFTVYCSGKVYKEEERKKTWNNARLVYLPLSANGVSSILYDILSIFHALFYADVILILGVSGAIILPFIKLFTRKVIIVNIDGVEWKREKWNGLAKWFLRISERIAIRFSDVDITDNEAIKYYTARSYKTLSSLIEYGADHATHYPITESLIQQFPFLRFVYAAKVCRIEPENNVEMILAAFAKTPERHFVLIGNWNHSEFSKKLRIQYEHFSNIHLLDPIYDPAQLNAIRANCEYYVHGHSAGGTNPSLVEAMYLGCPIVSFDVSYNRATTEDRALYFNSVESLIDILLNMDKAKMEEVKKHMLRIASYRYTWFTIGNKYRRCFELSRHQIRKYKLKPELSNLPTHVLHNLGLTQFKNLKSFYE